MVGVAGVSEGEGPGLSARIVDNAASGRSRSRAWTGGRASVPRPFGAGHCVQDPRRGGREAAQSPLLPGAPRPRVFGKDGRSAVRLSQSEAVEEGRSQVEGETNRGAACI